MEIIEDQIFEKENYTQKPLLQAEYENCRFVDCDFSNAVLNGIRFLECTFTGCNLSSASIVNTAFIDVSFTGSKMLGLHFETCNQFGLALAFNSSVLNHSSFYQTKLKKTVFKDCKLVEVEFTEADLSSAVFSDCDLSGAGFENTNLEKTDFRTAGHYTIDLEKNKCKKARFSQAGLPGLLTKYNIVITP